MDGEKLIILKEIIGEILERDIEINDKTAIIGEAILDSLEFMNYLTKIEEKFGIDISDEDVEKNQLGILGNMIQYLEKKI